MKPTKTARAHALVAAALLLVAAQANAAFVYQTTMTLTPQPPDDPTALPTAATAVFDWETNVMAGAIGSSDLVSLALTVLDSGNTPLYTDVMITGGVPQAIGGAARALTDIVWDFDLDTLTLTAFDNDLTLVQQDTPASGTTYNLYTTGGTDVLTAVEYVDGAESGNESTWARETSTQVPAPGAFWLLGAGLAGLIASRGRRAVVECTRIRRAPPK